MVARWTLWSLWTITWWVTRAVVIVAARVTAAGVSWFGRQREGVQALVAVGVAIAYLGVGARVDRAPPTDSEVETLARVIHSEIGSGSRTQRAHVAWATRNLARERGQSLTAMACSPCGRQQRGRPVSTRLGARDADRALARAILAAPASDDPTGGATHFINPVLQDELARTGAVSGYAGNTYARVRRRWRRSYGWQPYYRLGPELELWGPKR